MNLATDLHLVPRLRMCGVKTPFQHATSVLVLVKVFPYEMSGHGGGADKELRLVVHDAVSAGK